MVNVFAVTLTVLYFSKCSALPRFFLLAAPDLRMVNIGIVDDKIH